MPARSARVSKLPLERQRPRLHDAFAAHVPDVRRGGRLPMSKLFCLAAAAVLAAVPVSAEAKGGGSHAPHQAANSSSSAPLLRGNSGGDRKGGRYLAAPAAKKLPGKK